MGAGQNPTTTSELLEFIELKLFNNSSGVISKNDSVQSNEDLFKIFEVLIDVLDAAFVGAIPIANGSDTGLLSASNWTLFNNKENILTFNNGLTRTLNVASIDYSKTGNVYTGNGLVNSPLFKYTGTWFSGGNDETTKPFVLFEPTGITSTGWSTFGTTIGINAINGFLGHFLKAKVNNIDAITISHDGSVLSEGIIQTAATFRFFGAGNITATSNGVFTFYNNTSTSFTKINLGGLTASFPAIQRNAAKIQILLADSSAFAHLEVANDTYSNNWNGSQEVPTKNDVYDKIESLNIAESIYLPTFGNIANTSLYTARNANYFRIGNKVHVSGWVTFNITSSGILTQGSITLPIPPTMTNFYDAIGHITSSAGANLFGTIAANAASTYILVSFDIGNPLSAGTHTFSYSFTYKV